MYVKFMLSCVSKMPSHINSFDILYVHNARILVTQRFIKIIDAWQTDKFKIHKC